MIKPLIYNLQDPQYEREETDPDTIAEEEWESKEDK